MIVPSPLFIRRPTAVVLAMALSSPPPRQRGTVEEVGGMEAVAVGMEAAGDGVEAVGVGGREWPSD